MLAKNNFFRGWNNFFVEHDTRCCAGRKFADYILNISIKPYIISKKKWSISIDLKLVENIKFLKIHFYEV